MNSKNYFCFNHDAPEFPEIVDSIRKAKTYDYYEEIETIKPNRKSLIANDDESVIIYIENTTQEEWEDHLRKVFNDALNNVEDNFIYIDEFADDIDLSEIPDADAYIELWNDRIENSDVDCDSSYQFRWYEGI